LLGRDRLIGKECINLSRNVSIVFGARYAVQDRRDEVASGLTPVRRQSIDSL
jgi:hypothetical protein